MSDNPRTGRWEPYVAPPASAASVAPQGGEAKGKWQPYRPATLAAAQTRRPESAEARAGTSRGRGRWEPYRP
jgi:hypothetical protein